MRNRARLLSAAAALAAVVLGSSVASAAVLTEDFALLASNGVTGDNFGVDVGIDGNYAIVGARYAENPSMPGAPSGCAYIYEYSGGSWAEKAQLFPSMGDWDFLTGNAVDISGDTAVVCSYHAWVNEVEKVGMATVFQRDGGGNWNEVATLSASDGLANDNFGVDCAIDGDNIVVGAFNSDPDGASNAGSIYVYNRNQNGPNAWGEATKLTADVPTAGHNLGQSVAIDGNTIVAGAYSGSRAYIYDNDGAGNWTQTTMLSGSGRFGTGTSVDGDRVVVGAYQAAGNAGRAYVYERNEGGTNAWGQTAELAPSNGGGSFGVSTALEGDTVLVGASAADPGGVANAGAGYVYKLNQDDVWVETTLFTTTGRNPGDGTGGRVSLSGNAAILGGNSFDGAQVDTGGAHVYNVPTTTTGVVYPDPPGHVDGGPVVSGGTTPYAWYRADEGLGTVVDIEGNGSILWWADQSGNDRHLDVYSGNPSVVTDAETGKDAVAFDGDDTFIGTLDEWGHAAPGTVVCVWKATGFGNSTHAYQVTYLYDATSSAEGTRSRQLLDYGSNLGTGNDADWIEVGGYNDDDNTNNRTDRTATTTAALGLGDDVVDQWFVTVASHATGTTDIVRINGEEKFSGNMKSSGMDGIKVGTACTDAYKFVGEMCELIVFEGELSQSEIAAVEQRLMARWGLGGVVVLEGDLNGDGTVNSGDLDLVRGNWGGSGPAGDANSDGAVNSGDLDIVRANWGATAAAAVPEPGTLAALAALGALLAAIRRRRR